MHHFLESLPLLLIASQVLGTCVVILRNDIEIIVGADSKRQNIKGDGTSQGKFEIDYCKIRMAGDFYYTLVGFNDVLQMEIANWAAGTSKTIKEFAGDFSYNLAREYEKNFEYMRSNQSQIYYSQYTGLNKIVAQVAIFKIEDSKPHLVVFEFVNQTVGNSPIKIQPYPYVNESVHVLGYRNEYNDMPITSKSTLDSLQATNPISFINEVINLESSHHPEAVGGSIFILRLSADNKEWVDGKEPKC